MATRRSAPDWLGSSPDAVARWRDDLIRTVALLGAGVSIALLPLPGASPLLLPPVAFVIAAIASTVERAAWTGGPARLTEAVPLIGLTGPVALAAAMGPRFACLALILGLLPRLLASPPSRAALTVGELSVLSLALATSVVLLTDALDGLARADLLASGAVAIVATPLWIAGLRVRRHDGTGTITSRSVVAATACAGVGAVSVSALWAHPEGMMAVGLAGAIVGLSLTRTSGRGDRARRDHAVGALITALDHRHPDTAAHSARVSGLVVAMLDHLPAVSAAEREVIISASLIHDVGKVGTPDQALLKPGRLTVAERRLIEQHPAIGEDIVRRVDALAATAAIVRHHHERWDGFGYPDRLSGPAIPLGARLIAVADTYDAITHDRVYRAAMSHDEAIAELKAQRGSQFDPAVVDLFCAFMARPADDASATGRLAS